MPFDPRALVHFHYWIGKEDIVNIFRLSVQLQGKVAQQKSVTIDTAVQEKNITFPTDLKMAVRIIAKCRRIAEKENIELRRSYKRMVGEVMLNQRFKSHPRKRLKALASARKLKTIAGRLVRELKRKLPEQKGWQTKLNARASIYSPYYQNMNGN